MKAVSSLTEVALSAVKPNPFRQLDKFPLDEARVAILRKSIQRTDFWGNVVCRKRGEFYEIAYGHHRLEALRRELGAKGKVRLLVRELDDETMLKMMAADNDDAYNLSPGFILETVEAAQKFTRKQKGQPAKAVIAKFLGWPLERVNQALAQLGAIEREELSREAVKKLRTQREAIALHSTVQKAKKNNQKIPHQAQEIAAERIAHYAEHRGLAAREMRWELEREGHPLAPRKKEIEDF
ncbi:MAG: ParB/RepB/Spo0J family partition protein [Terriglobia bacterium]